MKTLHVVAGSFAAEKLRDVLAAAAIDERVLCFPDPLSVGPLDDVDTTGARRAAFWRRIDAEENWAAVRREDELAWSELSTTSGQVVVWHGPDPMEVLLMLRLAWRFRPRGRELHEIVRPRSLRKRPAIYDCVAVSSVDELSPLVHQHAVVDVDRRADEWAAACAAPDVCFRQLADDGTIVGLPEDGYDAHLLSHCSAEWTGVRRVLAHTISDVPVGAWQMWWRLRVMETAGLVEVRGDGYGGDVRLRASRRRSMNSTPARRGPKSR